MFRVRTGFAPKELLGLQFAYRWVPVLSSARGNLRAPSDGTLEVVIPAGWERTGSAGDAVRYCRVDKWLQLGQMKRVDEYCA